MSYVPRKYYTKPAAAKPAAAKSYSAYKAKPASPLKKSTPVKASGGYKSVKKAPTASKTYAPRSTVPKPLGSARRATVVTQRRTYPKYETHLRGHGNYFVDRAIDYLPAAGDFVGRTVGAAVAPGISFAGGHIGRQAGEVAKHYANKIQEYLKGHGEYHIEENSIMIKGQQPTVVTFEEDVVRIRKRECIGYINMTQAFTQNIYILNPCDQTTFPWLSKIAANYMKYKFNGLVFEYVGTSSTAIASTTDLSLGQIAIATDVDTVTGLQGWEDYLSMVSTYFSNMGNASDNIFHAVECSPKLSVNEWLYCRNAVPKTENFDDRLYDKGVTTLATQGSQSDYDNAGLLFVTYDVSLSESVRLDNIDDSLPLCMVGFPNAGLATMFGAGMTTEFNNTDYSFGIADNKLEFNNILPGDVLRVDYTMIGSVDSLGATGLVPAGTGCTISNAFWSAAVNDKVFSHSFIVKLTQPLAYVEWSSVVLPSTSVNTWCRISRVTSSVVS